MTGASEARSRRCSTSSSSPARLVAEVLDDRAHRAAALAVVALDQVGDLGAQADAGRARRGRSPAARLRRRSGPADRRPAGRCRASSSPTGHTACCFRKRSDSGRRSGGASGQSRDATAAAGRSTSLAASAMSRSDTRPRRTSSAPASRRLRPAGAARAPGRRPSAGRAPSSAAAMQLRRRAVNDCHVSAAFEFQLPAMQAPDFSSAGNRAAHSSLPGRQTQARAFMEHAQPGRVLAPLRADASSSARVRCTRSGCGISRVLRPSRLVRPVMPAGEPFGLAG